LKVTEETETSIHFFGKYILIKINSDVEVYVGGQNIMKLHINGNMNVWM